MSNPFTGPWAPTRFHAPVFEGGQLNVVADRLMELRFIEPLTQTSKGPHIGWVSPADLLVPPEACQDWQFNQYLVLCLRTDKKSVPPALFRAHLRTRVAKWCKENNRERCPASIKSELKEGLELEMLARVYPAVKTLFLIWNTAEATVWVLSQSQSSLDLARKLFHKTFGAMLIPFDAIDYLPAASNKPRAPDAEGVRADTISAFYAWLLNQEDHVPLEDDQGHVSVSVEGQITFSDGNGPITKLTTENPTGMPEARAALELNRPILSLTVRLAREDRVYVVTLGPFLTILRSNLPTQVKGESAEVLYDRMFCAEELHWLLGSLFRRYAGTENQGTQGPPFGTPDP